MAGGDHKLFNLGEIGVDLSASPIHAKDGSLRQAQNVEFFMDEGRGALRQRPPLRKLTSTPVTGATGYFGIPLADPFGYRLFASAFGQWQVSDDFGATWDFVDQPATTDPNRGLPVVYLAGGDQRIMLPAPVVNLNGRGYYGLLDPNDSSLSSVAVMAFDGDREYELARMPFEAVRNYSAATYNYAAGLFVHNGRLIVGQPTAPGIEATVFYAIDVETGDVEYLPMNPIGDDTGLGTAYGECVNAGVSWQGKIWIATGYAPSGVANTRKARILYARETEETWNEDRVAAGDDVQYTSLCIFNGELYATTLASNNGAVAAAAHVEKRTMDGTWTTDLSGSTTGTAVNKSMFHGLTVFQDELYAVWRLLTAGSTVVEIWKRTAGGSWSLDHSFTESLSATQSCVNIIAVNDTLIVNGGINFHIKRSGSWSTSNNQATSQFVFGAP